MKDKLILQKVTKGQKEKLTKEKYNAKSVNGI